MMEGLYDFITTEIASPFWYEDGWVIEQDLFFFFHIYNCQNKILKCSLTLTFFLKEKRTK